MFKKYNMNPSGKVTSDCVVRAISYATKKAWGTVYKDLFDTGAKIFVMPNSKESFNKYLENIGWKKQKMPRVQKGFTTGTKNGVAFREPFIGRQTVNEFCEANPKGIFIVSVANHLTVVDNGDIIDIWNCGNKSCGNYWTK